MAWLVDDGRLQDDDVLYRRLPRRPEFFVPRDAVTKRPTVTNASLTYDKDGMSVYSSALMEKFGVKIEDLYEPGRYGLARFEVGQARGGGLGLVVCPDENDPDRARGRAHVLVRSSAPPPDKRGWTERRIALRMALLVLDEDTWTWEPLAA